MGAEVRKMFVSKPGYVLVDADYSQIELRVLAHIARDENIVRQRMIQNAKRAYLLCATEKFGKAYYHNLCHKDDLTGIIHE